jgi:hypothetical protein
MTMRDSRDRCHFASEDVKEYWWYLDGLPSHAWLRWRYHYPQEPFPYQWLIDETADGPATNLSSSSWTPVFRSRPILGGGCCLRKSLGYPKCLPRSRSRTMLPKRRPSQCCRRCGSGTPGGSAVTRRPTCSWMGTASLLITPDCLATPAWKDNLLFYEYFHGDNGAGLGAMHQTGWTALVADLLLDPPRRVRRLVFYDDASITPDLTDVAAGPAG